MARLQPHGGFACPAGCRQPYTEGVFQVPHPSSPPSLSPRWGPPPQPRTDGKLTPRSAALCVCSFPLPSLACRDPKGPRPSLSNEWPSGRCRTPVDFFGPPRTTMSIGKTHTRERGIPWFSATTSTRIRSISFVGFIRCSHARNPRGAPLSPPRLFLSLAPVLSAVICPQSLLVQTGQIFFLRSSSCAAK